MNTHFIKTYVLGKSLTKRIAALFVVVAVIVGVFAFNAFADFDYNAEYFASYYGWIQDGGSVTVNT